MKAFIQCTCSDIPLYILFSLLSPAHPTVFTLPFVLRLVFIVLREHGSFCFARRQRHLLPAIRRREFDVFLGGRRLRQPRRQRRREESGFALQ